LHLQPPFAGAQTLGGLVGEGFFSRGVSLPCATELTEVDQDRVIDAVLAYFA
jgi:dTDP-4-amino-4,6-dideoxygalactose transaminase